MVADSGGQQSVDSQLISVLVVYNSEMDVCGCGFVFLPKQMTTETYFCLSQQMEDTKKKILATVFLDGREILKKVYQLHNAAELIDASKSEVPSAAELDRFRKYNKDFNEFIDLDHNTDIKELDKFHIFFLSGSGISDAQTEVICPVRLWDVVENQCKTILSHYSINCAVLLTDIK